MTEYSSIRRFTDEGLARFEKVMLGEAAAETIDASDPSISEAVAGTAAFKAGTFKTAKELAVAVTKAFNDLSPQEYSADTGLWAWLYFAMIDVLSPMKNGQRKVLEYVRWYPSPPNDYQKAQRHLVRMPVVLYSSFGNGADHLLCGLPHIGPEIREQLTSQQDIFSENFQRACRLLYFDDEKQALKRGAAGSGAGSARRMAKVRQQLDVTWDMTDLAAEKILQLLPGEFSVFLKAA